VQCHLTGIGGASRKPSLQPIVKEDYTMGEYFKIICNLSAIGVGIKASR